MLDNSPRGTIVIENLEVGMMRSLRKVVTDQDIEMFAEVSTDRNPVHLDDSYAQDTIFEGRIAHGMLTAGLISAVIGEQLPGHGTVYVAQSLRFLAPVRPGDTLTPSFTVAEARKSKTKPDRGIVHFNVEVRNQDGDTVLTFTSMTMIKTRNG